MFLHTIWHLATFYWKSHIALFPDAYPSTNNISVHLAWPSVPCISGEISSVHSLLLSLLWNWKLAVTAAKETHPHPHPRESLPIEEENHRGRTLWHACVCRGRWTHCLWFLPNKCIIAVTGWDLTGRTMLLVTEYEVLQMFNAWLLLYKLHLSWLHR